MLAFKKLFLAGACLLAASPMFGWEKDILISTPNTSLLLSAPENEALKIAYYGEKIGSDEVENIYSSGLAFDEQAYPAFGSLGENETALLVQHADGDMSLDLVVKNVFADEQQDARTTTITLQDRVYPFTVKVFYKAYKNLDVIETWSEIANGEKKPVTLFRYASGFLPIHQGDVWVSHLHGSWGAEGGVVTEPLRPGMLVVKNHDGVRNSHTSHAEVMISLDGKPTEQTGRVIGAALCWGGNFRLSFDTDYNRIHRFIAGIDWDYSQYILEPEETFVTPELALTYSDSGLGGVSRNLHKWGRETHLAHGTATRDSNGLYFEYVTENDVPESDTIGVGTFLNMDYIRYSGYHFGKCGHYYCPAGQRYSCRHHNRSEGHYRSTRFP